MALPFHSVDTEDEAFDLVQLYCALDKKNLRWKIRPDWKDQDVDSAIKYARKHFRLED